MLVLEARDRVGGRTLNHELGPAHPGKVVEIGGQWIGPTQDRIAKLARDLGVHTFKTYNKGNYLFYENGKLTPDNGAVNPIPPDVTAGVDLAKMILAMNDMAKTVPLQAPWTAPSAPDWDGQTFETFKRAQGLSRGGASLSDLATEAVFACEPRDVSLLHVLFYTHSAGNETTPGTFDRLITTGSGAQDSRFVGGSQLVSIRAARTLGKRVLLGPAGPADRAEPWRREGVHGHADRQGQGGHRHRTAVAHGTDPLRARPAGAARPAAPALPAGFRDQGRGGLSAPVLA